MAKLGDLTSIFQLAFGLNAVLPALYVSYQNSLETITKSVATALERRDPELKFTDRMMFELQDYLFRATPGLRFAKAATNASAVVSVMALGVSFIGLVEASIEPKIGITFGSVWLLSIALLLVIPGFALGTEWVLHRYARLLITEWSKSADFAPQNAFAFHAIWKSRLKMDELEPALRQANDFLAKLKFEEAKGELIGSAKRAVASFALSFLTCLAVFAMHQSSGGIIERIGDFWNRGAGLVTAISFFVGVVAFALHHKRNPDK